MTIAEIRAAKQEAEAALREILTNLQQRTGLRVDGVSLVTHSVVGTSLPIVAQVRIALDLDLAT